MAIHHNLAEPDPLRLTHHSRIKDTVCAVVLEPQADTQIGMDTTLSVALSADVPERQALRPLILDE